MKRFLSLFLAAMMLCGLFSSTCFAAEKQFPFGDIEGHWASSAIEPAYGLGLMNGVGNGENFDPNGKLTRGMVVTVLYRDNNSPAITFEGTFKDVSENAYYANAVEWAFKNDIVNGTGNDSFGNKLFSPDNEITRQELATMFTRYAKFMDVEINYGVASILGYPDYSEVASWASLPFKWCINMGIINGKSINGSACLCPTDKATRGEFATIIKRFHTNVFKGWRSAYAEFLYANQESLGHACYYEKGEGQFALVDMNGDIIPELLISDLKGQTLIYAYSNGTVKKVNIYAPSTDVIRFNFYNLRIAKDGSLWNVSKVDGVEFWSRYSVIRGNPFSYVLTVHLGGNNNGELVHNVYDENEMKKDSFNYYMNYEKNVITQEEYSSLINQYKPEVRCSYIDPDDFYFITPYFIDSVLK